MTELYQFLRTVDDIVDESKHDAAASQLEQWMAEIPPADANGLIRMAGISFNLDRTALSDFLAGQHSDLEWQPVRTETELISYCYKVAGTVGIMLCPVLGAQGENARVAALRLGIAMQLTNIARDVLEDAARGRVYLPANWFASEMSPIGITQAGRAQEVVDALQRLLKLAELYYSSAASGFRLLPPRQRFVIILATRLYRQIGRKIIDDPKLALAGRVRLTRRDRAAQFVWAACEWISLLGSVPHTDANPEERELLARLKA